VARNLKVKMYHADGELHLTARLGVRTRRAAVAKALRLGLIREP